MSLPMVARPALARRGGGNVDVLVAACLWGTTGTVRTFVPAATNVSIAGIRIVLGGVLLLIFAACRASAQEDLRQLLGRRRNQLLLGLGAVTLVTYQTAFFSAAGRTGVAIGTIVTIGSAPAFAGLLGLMTRQAPLTRRWLLATAAAVIGCAALIGGGDDAGIEAAGIGLALLAGLSYAVYATVLSTLIAHGEPDRTVTSALFGAAALLMLPVVLSGSAAWVLTGSGALIALYLGGVATAGGYLLFARGLRTTPATTATTLTLAEPAVAALLGVTVLNERLGGVALGGLTLLAASLTVLARPDRP